MVVAPWLSVESHQANQVVLSTTVSELVLFAGARLKLARLNKDKLVWERLGMDYVDNHNDN